MTTQQSSSLLDCQINSYDRIGYSLVVSCEKRKEDDNYLVVLDNSVLYPEGGGQPFDLGTVNDIPVVSVSKCTDVNNTKAVSVLLIAPVQAGETVKCEVDWERRYDFMQQHTAQHLFSAVADKLFSADTVGWALGPDSVTVDLSSSPELNSEQLKIIEDETNAMIRKGNHVEWKIFSKEELTQTEPSSHEQNEGSLQKKEYLQFMRGGPKGAALQLNELRMVYIEDLDLNPCGGTHLQSISEINLLKIIGTEKDRGSIRVRFVAGNRALKYFTECLNRESFLTNKLAVPPIQHTSMIEKLLKDKKDLLKKSDIYSDELAQLSGYYMANNMTNQMEPIFIYHRKGADLKILMKMADVILNIHPTALIFLSGDEEYPVLSSYLNEQPFVSSSKKDVAKNSKSKSIKSSEESDLNAKLVSNLNLSGSGSCAGPFILFGNKDQVDICKSKLLGIVKGKGGGKPGRLQGQASDLSAEKLMEIEKLLHEIFATVKLT